MTFRSASLLLLLSALFCAATQAQSPKTLLVDPVASKVSLPEAGTPIVRNDPAKAESPKNSSEKDESATDAAAPAASQFRLERTPLLGGAELLTIFGRLDGLRDETTKSPEVPLVSVVRDTLSDNNPENDRLRYVWMLTYTRPNLMKRIASGIPFFYQHVSNQTRVGSSPPKPLIDLANTSRQTWDAFFWMGVQSIFLDSYGIPLKAASRTYRQNAADYRSGHVIQALSILENYENVRRRTRDENELLAMRNSRAALNRPISLTNDSSQPLLPNLAPAFSPGEMLEVRARLIMSGEMLGGLLVFTCRTLRGLFSSFANCSPHLRPSARVAENPNHLIEFFPHPFIVRLGRDNDEQFN